MEAQATARELLDSINGDHARAEAVNAELRRRAKAAGQTFGEYVTEQLVAKPKRKRKVTVRQLQALLIHRRGQLSRLTRQIEGLKYKLQQMGEYYPF